MQATTQYFGKLVFYKLVLEYHRPSKFLCQTSGGQSHWSLMSSITYIYVQNSSGDIHVRRHMPRYFHRVMPPPPLYL
jgi:hypothetical protein